MTLRRYVRTTPAVTDANRLSQAFAEYIEYLVQRIEALETENATQQAEIDALDVRVTALETP